MHRHLIAQKPRTSISDGYAPVAARRSVEHRAAIYQQRLSRNEVGGGRREEENRSDQVVGCLSPFDAPIRDYILIRAWLGCVDLVVRNQIWSQGVNGNAVVTNLSSSARVSPTTADFEAT
jgi:hypothetical protein